MVWLVKSVGSQGVPNIISGGTPKIWVPKIFTNRNLKMILFGSDGFSSFFFGGYYILRWTRRSSSFRWCKGTWTPESLDDLFLCRSWRSCKIRTLWRRPLRHPVARAWLQELLTPPAKRTNDWLEKNNPGFEDVSPIVKSWFSNVISPFRWVGGEEILFLLKDFHKLLPPTESRFFHPKRPLPRPLLKNTNIHSAYD